MSDGACPDSATDHPERRWLRILAKRSTHNLRLTCSWDRDAHSAENTPPCKSTTWPACTRVTSRTTSPHSTTSHQGSPRRVEGWQLSDRDRAHRPTRTTTPATSSVRTFVQASLASLSQPAHTCAHFAHLTIILTCFIRYPTPPPCPQTPATPSRAPSPCARRSAGCAPTRPQTASAPRALQTDTPLPLRSS